MKDKYKSIEDIVEVTKEALGKSVKDFIAKDESMSYSAKGSIGNIIESGLYGLEINNKQAPDFENIGVELKVTGYKWVYKGSKVSAKERLVITMIDYFNDINKSFYDTHLYSKIKKMFMLLYEYEDNKSFEDFILTNYFLYEFDKIPEKDKIIIIKDFKQIMNKIRNGYAHELSEGDTMYLGACPKGADSSSLRSQPYSEIKAMSRAFSLKTTYMTYILRNHIFHEVESKEELIKDLNILKEKSIDEIIEDIFRPYKNKTLDQIDLIIGENLNRKRNKQLMKSYTSRMLNISEKNYEHIEEFEKANIQIKTITLEANGKLKESMSFPSMDFIQVANETWEDSELKEFFETTKFLFVVFQKTNESSNRNHVFKGAFLWNMPISDIDVYINKVWMDMHHILNNDIEIKIKNNVVYNNFPKSKLNPVSHVRPHGRDRRTTKKLPDKTNIKILENDGSVDLSIYLDENKYTAMCFWLNNTYILDLVNKSIG